MKALRLWTMGGDLGNIGEGGLGREAELVRSKHVDDKGGVGRVEAADEEANNEEGETEEVDLGDPGHQEAKGPGDEEAGGKE